MCRAAVASATWVSITVDAGATAAYLIDQWLGDSPASVLVTLSSNAFRGEEEREMGFRGEMRRALGGAGRAAVEIADSEGSTLGSDRVSRAGGDQPALGLLHGDGRAAVMHRFDQRGGQRGGGKAILSGGQRSRLVFGEAVDPGLQLPAVGLGEAGQAAFGG